MDRRLAALLFVVALVGYAALAGPRLFRQSAAPHFVYQSAAFLQGRLDIAVEPPNGNDWASGPDGRLHVSFPPGPTLLFLPAVAVFGYRTGDVGITVGLAAANIALLFLLLRTLARDG